MSVELHSFTEENEVSSDRGMQTDRPGSSQGDVPTYLHTGHRFIDVEAGQSAPEAGNQAAGNAACPGGLRQKEMGVKSGGGKGGGHPYVGLPSAWGLRILNPPCTGQVGRLVTLNFLDLMPSFYPKAENFVLQFKEGDSFDCFDPGSKIGKPESQRPGVELHSLTSDEVTLLIRKRSRELRAKSQERFEIEMGRSMQLFTEKLAAGMLWTLCCEYL